MSVNIEKLDSKDALINLMYVCSEKPVSLSSGYEDCTTNQSVLGAPTFDSSDHAIAQTSTYTCELSEEGKKILKDVIAKLRGNNNDFIKSKRMLLY